MVLCDRNIAELRDILNRKAPKYLPDAEVLLAEMSYELIPAVDHAEKLIFKGFSQSTKMSTTSTQTVKKIEIQLF